jgi:hypothetical protein
VNRLLTLARAMAYRRARRSGGRAWWIVLGAVWLVRRGERREDRVERYTLRRGQELDISVHASENR